MQTVNMHEAKTHLSRFVQQVTVGDDILIARAGQPVARLTRPPVEEAEPRVLGLGEGKFRLPEAFSSLQADTIRDMFEMGE